MSKKKNLTRELAEELDTLDMMLSSLVEVLERKGILAEDEWEKQIKANIEKTWEKPSIETFISQNSQSQIDSLYSHI
jgi:ElaB/YqjD/DUF883 family membrane-anchored ribosome-binding protein